MSARIVTSICLAALILSGCGGVDNSVTPPPEELAKIKTEPTPEKDKSGKQSLTKLKD